MSGFLREETFLERRKMIDYIYGLVRYEIYHDDDPTRLQVLNKIYSDLLYIENLDNAKNWERKAKGKDDLMCALEKIEELTTEIAKLNKKLEVVGRIKEKMTKKEILELLGVTSKSA